MENVPSILQSYIHGLKTHDVQKIADTVSEQLAFVLPEKRLDKSQFLNMLRALYSAFPDWRYEYAQPEIADGIVAIKWRQSGTHTGAFVMAGLEPIAATGRSVRIADQYFFYKFRADQIQEIRPDPVPGGAPGAILEQIGADATRL